MNRKQIFNILKIIISLGLLAFIFSSIDIPELLGAIRQAKVGWLIAALIAVMLGIIIRAFRWKILLN
ncbi:MAG: lysylphosphatidylglycerol synthase domain-containing protein, partial [Chloroflexota bacterium]